MGSDSFPSIFRRFPFFLRFETVDPGQAVIDRSCFGVSDAEIVSIFLVFAGKLQFSCSGRCTVYPPHIIYFSFITSKHFIIGNFFDHSSHSFTWFIAVFALWGKCQQTPQKLDMYFHFSTLSTFSSIFLTTSSSSC